MLAELAVNEPAAFNALVEIAKNNLPRTPRLPSLISLGCVLISEDLGSG